MRLSIPERWTTAIRGNRILNALRDEAILRLVLIVVSLGLIGSYLFSSLGFAFAVRPPSSHLKVLAVTAKDIPTFKIHEDNAPYTLKKYTLVEVAAKRATNSVCIPLQGEASNVPLSVASSQYDAVLLVGIVEAGSKVMLKNYPSLTGYDLYQVVPGQQLLVAERKGDWLLVFPKGRNTSQGPGWLNIRNAALPLISIVTKAGALSALTDKAPAFSLSPGETYQIRGVIADKAVGTFYLIERGGRFFWVPATAAAVTGRL